MKKIRGSQFSGLSFQVLGLKVLVFGGLSFRNNPWYTTGADLFTHDGSKYLHLVTADYYFKYPFVRQTDSQCAKQNQHRLENNETASYRKQGIPKLVRTKNGVDFNGLVFQELAQELNFENITSSPHYPHYNGFIKAKSVKSAEVKFDQAKSDFDMLLLCLGGTHGDH